MERNIKSTWGTEHHRLPTWPPAENCTGLNLVTQSVIHKPKGRAVKIFILIWLPIKWSWETLLRSVPVNVLLMVRRSNHSRFRWCFASARAVTYRVTWSKVQNVFSVWSSKKLALYILTLRLPCLLLIFSIDSDIHCTFTLTPMADCPDSKTFNFTSLLLSVTSSVLRSQLLWNVALNILTG